MTHPLTVLLTGARLLVVVLLILLARACVLEDATSAIPPPHDDAIYWEDPCVAAMQRAMEEMTPYVPHHFRQLEDGFWYSILELTEAGRQDYEFAAQTWKDTILQCWRTPT